MRFSSLWFLFVLSVPPPAGSEFSHTVKPGESLFSIAKKNHISVLLLREANGLGDEKIYPGQHLVVPEPPFKAEIQQTLRKVPPQGAWETEDPEIPDRHTVKEGETLAIIAQRYHLRVVDLQEINPLSGERLKVGQVLYLPRLEESPEEIEPGREKSKGEEVAEGTQAAQAQGKGIGFLFDPKDPQLLVRVAKSFLGIKYILGGSSRNGMDCSAFVQKVFRIVGIDLPRTAREQFQVGCRVAREALQVGDLVFFKRSKTPRPAHVGIYIGDGRFIHTSLRKRRVYIDSLNSRYFGAQFIGAKRIEDGRRPTEIEKSNYPSTSQPREGSFHEPVCP
jgi:cell wall-associated NlpC family hydrolase